MADDPRRKLLDLERERWRRQCRRDLMSFAVEALAPAGQKPAMHHRLICHRLMQLVRGELARGIGFTELMAKLMVLAPPGSAKTTFVSRLFVAWYFASHPRSNIIGVSHVASLAETNSAYIQRYINDNFDVLGYGLLNDNKADWFTANGCEYLAVGVGGTVRGFRADVIVIDDPIKDREAAESETSRESLWEYYHSDLTSRLKPDGKVILIATPLHENDLMCRLIREQGDDWHVVRLPAISEGEGDALGRPEGMPLWVDDPAYGYGEKLLQLQQAAEREGRQRDWFAQYMGRPRPPEGAMFKPARMPVFDVLPERVLARVRAWDLASSASRAADWTVGLKLVQLWDQGAAYEDMWIVTDVQRMRGTPDEVRRLVRTIAQADGYGTEIWIPQDPAQAGVDQVDSYIRMLSGFPVKAERMSGDKVTRADACASQCNVGRIGILRAPWNAGFIDELGAFPRGVHDDQVDALSLAFSKLDNSPLLRWARLSR
jgi:predicted phage terminase large subunit-like protein